MHAIEAGISLRICPSPPEHDAVERFPRQTSLPAPAKPVSPPAACQTAAPPLGSNPQDDPSWLPPYSPWSSKFESKPSGWLTQ